MSARPRLRVAPLEGYDVRRQVVRDSDDEERGGFDADLSDALKTGPRACLC